MNRKLFFYYSVVFLAMFFWAFSFIWYKMANKYLAPVTIVWLRLSISSLMLWIFTQIFGYMQKIRKRDRKKILLLTLFNPFLYFIGESFGLTYVSSSVGSVVISLIPLITPFAAHFFLDERLTFMNWTGVFISFAGVLLILSVKNSGESSWEGIALLLFAVFCAVAYTVLLKKLSFRYNALTLITWQNFIGALLFFPLFLILDVPGISRQSFVWKSMIPVLELAVFASSLAFVFYAIGVKHLGAAKTNVFSNIMPVVTAIFAYFLLRESLSLAKIGGIAIVISGLFLSQVQDSFVQRILKGVWTKKKYEK